MLSADDVRELSFSVDNVRVLVLSADDVRVLSVDDDEVVSTGVKDTSNVDVVWSVVNGDVVLETKAVVTAGLDSEVVS